MAVCVIYAAITQFN